MAEAVSVPKRPEAGPSPSRVSVPKRPEASRPEASPSTRAVAEAGASGPVSVEGLRLHRLTMLIIHGVIQAGGYPSMGYKFATK